MYPESERTQGQRSKRPFVGGAGYFSFTLPFHRVPKIARRNTGERTQDSCAGHYFRCCIGRETGERVTHLGVVSLPSHSRKKKKKPQCAPTVTEKRDRTAVRARSEFFFVSLFPISNPRSTHTTTKASVSCPLADGRLTDDEADADGDGPGC